MRLDEVRTALADATPKQWTRAPRPPLGGGPGTPPSAGVFLADNDLTITWGLVASDPAHANAQAAARQDFGATISLGVVDAFWRGMHCHRQLYLVCEHGNAYLPLPRTRQFADGTRQTLIADGELGLIHTIHDLDDKHDYYRYLVQSEWLIQPGD